MGDVKVSRKRMRELQLAESKLSALEAAGVDNWDGYDDALSDYRREIAVEERREEFLDDLLSELAGGAYEPSEHGAGVAYHDDAIEAAHQLMVTYGVTFTKGLD